MSINKYAKIESLGLVWEFGGGAGGGWRDGAGEVRITVYCSNVLQSY